MPLPGGISTCTLTAGSSLTMFGDAATVTVVVTPVYGGSVRRIIWAVTGQSLADFPKVFSSDSEVSFVVPHVNQAGFLSPDTGLPFSMWKYQIEVTLSQGGQTRTYSQEIQPVIGQSVIDLDNPTNAGIVTVVNNGDGTFTLSGPGVTDNGDGTWTAIGPPVTDNLNGTFTVVST